MKYKGEKRLEWAKTGFVQDVYVRPLDELPITLKDKWGVDEDDIEKVWKVRYFDGDNTAMYFIQEKGKRTYMVVYPNGRLSAFEHTSMVRAFADGWRSALFYMDGQENLGAN